jgi:hypothetical protein
MSKEPDAHAERDRRLLLAALEKAQIEEYETARANSDLIGGPYLFWRKADGLDDVIELVFVSHTFVGRFHAGITLNSIATQAADAFFNDDAEAVNAIVVALEYMQGVIAEILPDAHRGIHERSLYLGIEHGNAYKKRAAKMIRSFIIQPSNESAKSRRAELEKHLRATRDIRGGSKPKLQDSERKSIHTQYDELHALTKAVKQDHDARLKRFAKQHLGRGYKPKNWQDDWASHVAEKYPALQGFLKLFANQSNPTPSKIAYAILAKRTGHKRKYLPKLVTESRKLTKTATVEKPD